VEKLESKTWEICEDASVAKFEKKWKETPKTKVQEVGGNCSEYQWGQARKKK
jgi:hypothetical protein